MRTFLLTWNPDRWPWPQAAYDQEVAETAAGKTTQGRWSTGSRRSGIEPGDRAFLVRQDTDRGLIASGTFATRIRERKHWDGSGRMANYADVDWEVIVPVEDRLPVTELKIRVPAVPWDALRGSGVQVSAEASRALSGAWEEHVDGIPFQGPGEAAPGTYPEGDVTRIEVNRYERDRRARAECISKYGTDCSACGFSFESAYGPLGYGFVHVHHIRDLSLLGPGYQLDPIKDLRPVCANCHSMLHTSRPAITIRRLQGHLKRAQNK